MAKEENDLHKNYKPFECNLCGKKFSEETNIKKHLYKIITQTKNNIIGSVIKTITKK